MTPKRDYTASVILHWLAALFVFVAFSLGGQARQQHPNDAPEKINALKTNTLLGHILE